jgi:O-antigen ligase
MKTFAALPTRTESQYPVEFSWLLGLAFFLPLLEAPKNLCWLGYALTWLYNRIRAREWGGPWDRWDGLIALWIASGYLAAAFAGIHHDEWNGATDVLRYGSVLWLIRRSRYDERALLWILGTVVVSTLITLFGGYWRVYIAKTHDTLELHSVGHVNHSAIYVAIVLGLTLSISIAYWRRIRFIGRVALSISVVALIVSVFVTESRAAVGAVVLFVVVLAVALGARGRVHACKGALVALLGIAIVFAAESSVLDKTIDRTERGLVFSFRDKIWSNALVEWRRFPWFGVGMGNFGRVNFEQLQEWNTTQNWSVRASAEGMNSHAHSLYMTALAERGLIGLGVLMVVLFASGYALLRGVPHAQDPPRDWVLFGGALAGWLITVTVGLVNTTLHHEHGILSVLLFGLWLSHRAARVQPDRTSPP